MSTVAKLPRQRGRPPVPVERRRIQTGMRLTPELRDRLVAQANANGRSITQELEILLELGLLVEQWLWAGLGIERKPDVRR